MKEKNTISNLDDELLVKKYQETKDVDMVGILYLRYSHLIFGLCLKYLKNVDSAKDASLEIFEVLVEKLKSHDVKYFKSWLYILSKNHCLMILRKANKNPVVDQNPVDEYTDQSSFNLELKLLKERKLVALESAIIQLKPRQSECIKLFYLEGKSYDEISQELKESRKSIKSYIQNGRRNLKLILQNHVFEE